MMAPLAFLVFVYACVACRAVTWTLESSREVRKVQTVAFERWTLDEESAPLTPDASI